MRGTWTGGGFGGGGFIPFSLGSIPLVRGILLVCVAVFLLFFLSDALRSPLVYLLAFSAGPETPGWLVRPWTLLTYAVLITSPWSLLLSGYWLYVVGGMLERSWGWRNFAVLLAAFTAIAALAFVPAAYLFQIDVRLAGLILPLSSLTVAWAAMDPDLEIYFWGIIPVRLKYLALIDVLLVYFGYGLGYRPWGPVIGLFALAGPAAAWVYVRKLPRLNIGFRSPRPPRQPRTADLLREEPPRERAEGARRPNPFRRRQEQREIERLRKLLGEDDDGDTAIRH